MKRILFFLIVFASSPVLKAQVFFFDTRSQVQKSEEERTKTRKRIVACHISHLHVFRHEAGDKKNPEKGYLSEESAFDEHGNCAENKSYDKHGNIRFHSLIKYDNKNNYLEETNFGKNDKFRYKVTYTYDDKSNLTDTRFYWKKPDVMTWHIASTYNEKQDMIENKYLYSQDKKLYDRYVYTYYPDDSKKQTIQYNSKGKIKHIWNYDCNPSGALSHKTLKDTSKICVRYETDKEGNKIKIKEEIVRRGKEVRTVSKFDKNDNLLDWSGYDRKGRIRSHTVAVFDDKNNMTESTHFKKYSTEVERKFVFQYDSAGNLSSEKGFKDSSTPVYVLTYEFSALK